MPDAIAEADIGVLFSRTLVMYKDKPVFVHRGAGRIVTIEFLESNTVQQVNFSLEDFKPLTGRLGYVNTAIGCAYVYRRPVRRYQVGISYENTSIYEAPTQFQREIVQDLSTFRSRFFLDTINGVFPDTESAFLNAQALGTSFAFDRQFCVDYAGNIYYRAGKHVGKFVNGELVFQKEYQYLSSLLDGSYGKSC